MAYTKQTWIAPTGTGLSRYAKSGETDTHIELALDPVNLTNTPTPITVARLNHMEDGIAEAAETATLATQALAIKPLGNSITLPAVSTSVTKIIKIASITYAWAGNIKIICSGGGISGNTNLYFGQRSDRAGLQVTYSKEIATYGIKKIIITRDGADGGSPRNIYAEFTNLPNYLQSITLGVVETETGTFTPSMTEVLSVVGTVLDSLALDYQRGDISSYQHVFTKNIIGNLTGNVTGNSGTASKANVRVSLRHGNTWFDKTWTGLPSFNGDYIWTDGDNIYYSNTTQQFVLNKTTATWTVKTWTGLTDFAGLYIWTDGENIYYGNTTTQYVLNKVTSTWTAKTWIGLTSFYGRYIWTDGDNIYHSNGTTQYVLNKTTSTWVAKTWTGLTSFGGDYIWTDGDNIYHSTGTIHYVLNKTTSAWTAKTWTGLTNFYGDYIWTDGDNIYYSNATTQYVLNKATSAWTAKTWTGLTNFGGDYIWTDGDNIYHSNTTTQHVLPATRHNYVDDAKYNSLFGTVTKCVCSPLSDRFVFRNE